LSLSKIGLSADVQFEKTWYHAIVVELFASTIRHVDACQ
jgi:hypothetical protein